MLEWNGDTQSAPPTMTSHNRVTIYERLYYENNAEHWNSAVIFKFKPRFAILSQNSNKSLFSTLAPPMISHMIVG